MAVLIEHDESQGMPLSVITDDEGYYEVRGVPGSEAVVRTYGRSMNEARRTVQLGDEPGDLVVTTWRHWLRCLVTLPDGRPCPLADIVAWVDLTPKGERFDPPRQWRVSASPPDKRGLHAIGPFWEVEGQVPRVWLAARCQDFVAVRVSALDPSGDSPVRLQLALGGYVEGTIRDGAGQALDWVRVVAGPAATGWPATRTRADGSFRLGPLPEGEHTLVFSRAARSTERTVRVLPGQAPATLEVVFD